MATLKDVLQLESLQHGEPLLLVGAARLDVVIRWVHVSDHPDVASALEGGELILTHGLGIGADEKSRRLWVDSLADAGVTALGIRLEHAFKDLPAEIYEECLARNLILFTLGHRLDFARVTREAHELILDEQHGRVLESLKIGQLVGETALSRGGIQETLRVLAAGLGNPVVLEDGAHRIVGYAKANTSIDNVIRQWDSHSRQPHHGNLNPLEPAPSELKCLHAELRIRDNTWGRLHVLEVDQSLHAESLVAIQQCAVAIVASLAQGSGFGELAISAQRDLLSDLFGQRMGHSDVLRHASVLGVDLSGNIHVIVVDADSAPLVPRLREVTERKVENVTSNYLIAETGKRRIVVLASFASSRDLEAAVNGIIHDVEERSPGEQVRIGISDAHTMASAATAFDEAGRASAAASFDVSSSVTARYFSRLGVERLFTALADGPELVNFIEAELGPVLQHDSKTSRTLIPILETYLSFRGNKTDAAKALYMSRRSLYSKLELIEGLIGKDLNDPSTQLSLSVALRALRSFRDRNERLF